MQTAGDSKLPLDFHGTGGKSVVGCGGSQQNEIDIGRLQAGILDRRARGGGAKRNRGFVIACNVPLADTRALHDPFVRGFDDTFEIGILHDPLRQCRTDTPHDRSYHLLFPVLTCDRRNERSRAQPRILALH